MVHCTSVSEVIMFKWAQIMFYNICVLTSAPSMYIYGMYVYKYVTQEVLKISVTVYTDIACQMYCILLLHFSSIVGCSQGSVC